MAQATVSFRMDDDLKKRMEIICDEMGMNLTTAFTIFAKKVTREHRIPFEVEADPFHSEATIRELERRAARLEAGLGHEHELIEVDD